MDIKNTFNKVKDKVVGAIIEKEDDLSGVDDVSLIFSTIESHNLNIQSTITDYWLEDQTAIQDCIGLQPVQISLSGLVGDYFYTVNQIEDMLALITPTITLVKEFIPQITNLVQKQKISFANEQKQKLIKQDDGSYKVLVNGKEYEYEFNPSIFQH